MAIFSRGMSSIVTNRWLLAASAVVVALLAALATTLSVAAAAAASNPPGGDLTGCKGTVQSFDSSGKQIDTITFPSAVGSSSSSPFHVDSGGKVAHDGSSDNLILNNSWHVSVAGITVRSGGAPNKSHTQSDKGTDDVSKYMPFKVTGLYYAEFKLSGDGGSCSGNMWVKLVGSPVGTPAWIAGIVLAVLGVVGLYFLGRPSLGDPIAVIGQPTAPTMPPTSPGGGGNANIT